MRTEQQYINQSCAEMAVLVYFDLPRLGVPEEEGFLGRYPIHALLHGDSGIPQQIKEGDLVVLCEVFEGGRRVGFRGIRQVTDWKGTMREFCDVGAMRDKEELRSRIAAYLVERRKVSSADAS